MVNTNEISIVYEALFTTMVAKYDDLWGSNEIDAETYAKLVGEASSQLMSLSAQLVQKQEELEVVKDKGLEEILGQQKQNLLLDEQILLAYTERVLKDKQAAKLGLDNVMKQSEASKDGDANFVYTPKYTRV